ncbi:SMI1/KNR4 family protein [Planotetraspora kaengkrachanensis]|uniref:SMI1/KNR4 family protein n=1 Tax=Planotetraspora kaengkrachanensis TaxID=575193 RepID=UPI0019418C26|nr:SMI1/KNR4 family protein [Planotetraspora kaengkrachanensis]
MPNRFDLHSELAAGVQDKDSAWTFIRRFAEAWMTPLGDGDGYSEEELNAAEDRLGLKLPAALREAYMLFGRRDNLCRTMHRLESPAELHVDEDAGLLVYHVENSGVWVCGIRLTDLGLEDPPVVHLPGCGANDHPWTGITWLDRLSSDCIEIVLTEALWNVESRPYCTNGHVSNDDNPLSMHGELLAEDIAELDHRFTPLALPPYPVERWECTPGSRWYAGEDVILCLDLFVDLGEHEYMRGPWDRPWSRAGLSIRGRTPEAINAMCESLPKEWFHWEWRQPWDPYPPKPQAPS